MWASFRGTGKEVSMIYRGFQIERVIYHANEGMVGITVADSCRRMVPHQRIE